MAAASKNSATCAHHHSETTFIMQNPIVSHTIETDIIFTRKGMARYSLKLRIYSPKRG